MAASTNIKNAIDLALFMQEVQKYDCLYNKFSREYRETWGTRKSTAGKQSERNSIKVLKRSSLSFPSSSRSKNTHNYASSRSRRFAAAMLNLRNGANYAVRPRHPRSSFCDRSDRNDHLETINRFDRWTILVRDRSDHMETRLYPLLPRAHQHITLSLCPLLQFLHQAHTLPSLKVFFLKSLP